VEFEGYQTEGFYDEMFGADGEARPEAHLLLETIQSLEEEADEEAAREALNWAASGAAVVLLVHHAPPDWIADMLRRGVKAVLPSSLTGPQIVASIEAASQGLVVVHPADAEVFAAPGARTSEDIARTFAEPLTQREIEVLRLLAEGFANKEIAARLKLSEHTVKFHVASIMGKLGASSRTEAVTLGIRSGIVMI
jgi:two-component system, NarL family, response regulator YdfI